MKVQVSGWFRVCGCFQKKSRNVFDAFRNVSGSFWMLQCCSHYRRISAIDIMSRNRLRGISRATRSSKRPWRSSLVCCQTPSHQRLPSRPLEQSRPRWAQTAVAHPILNSGAESLSLSTLRGVNIKSALMFHDSGFGNANFGHVSD